MSTELETRLAATLTRVADATPIPLFPSLDAPGEPLRRPARTPRFARRRLAVAGIAAVAVLGGGLSIAAAAGAPVLPSPVMRALGWAQGPGGYNADPAMTRRILSVPGPNGVPLTLWYSDTNDHGYCVSFTANVVGDPDVPSGFHAASGGPPLVGTAANGCRGPVGDRSWERFGGAAFSSANSQTAMFIVHVPGAASVRLRFADGSSRPLPLADAWTAGWMTHAQAANHPMLVGYSAYGTVMGRFDLTRFTADGG